VSEGGWGWGVDRVAEDQGLRHRWPTTTVKSQHFSADESSSALPSRNFPPNFLYNAASTWRTEVRQLMQRAAALLCLR
jgi:hypothetical protein